MKTRLQAILGALLVFAIALTPGDALAHGNGKKKGHHKHKNHHRHEAPPSYAPVYGYHHQVVVQPIARYVYNPEYNIYYDRREQVYFFISRGQWVFSAQLPMQLNSRTVRNGFQVSLSYADDCRNHHQFALLERNRQLEQRRLYSSRR